MLELLPLVLGGEAEDEVEEDAVEDGPAEQVEHHPPFAVLHHADGEAVEDGVAVERRVRGEDPLSAELVHEEALVGVLHRGNGVHPLPPQRDAVAVDEVAAEEEEERREGDHRRVSESRSRVETEEASALKHVELPVCEMNNLCTPTTYPRMKFGTMELMKTTKEFVERSEA